MHIEAGRISTLWFILPSVCVDVDSNGNMAVAAIWLNWQLCLESKNLSLIHI